MNSYFCPVLTFFFPAKRKDVKEGRLYNMGGEGGGGDHQKKTQTNQTKTLEMGYWEENTHFLRITVCKSASEHAQCTRPEDEAVNQYWNTFFIDGDFFNNIQTFYTVQHHTCLS